MALAMNLLYNTRVHHGSLELSATVGAKEF